MKKVLYALFAAVLSGTTACQAAKTASQPWVKDWVRANVQGANMEDVNQDTDVWFDGEDLVFKNDAGEIVRLPNITFSFRREVEGLTVVDASESGGVVSNAMFYADIGDGQYSKPENGKMPVIRFVGTIEQTGVRGKKKTYEKYEAYEYGNKADGTAFRNKWISQQIASDTFRIYFIDEETNYRGFLVKKSKGAALQNSPAK